jgi:hypothetical protein
MLYAGRSQIRNPVRSLKFSIYLIISALRFAQPLTELSVRRGNVMLEGSRERPVRKADKLTATCEPNI